MFTLLLKVTLAEDLDLRNSLLRGAMNAADVPSMPITTAVDGPRIQQFLQAFRQLLPPIQGIQPLTQH